MRTPIRLLTRLALATTASTLLVGSGTGLQAQQCASGPPTTLGTVKVVSTTCPGGIGRLPRSSCRLLRITCQGIPDIDVQVRVSEPGPKLALRGTIVFGTGGGGTGFYGDRTGGPELLGALQNLGFRIVDRRWQKSWFGLGSSVRKQSCRYATLLTWVHTNVHTRGAFCATGNSGGSAELSYALTTWGRGAILDVAVPSGGPPMARLDYLCQNPPSTTWANLCRSLVPKDFMECASNACTVQPTHAVCTSCSSNATQADLHADSILHPGAAVHFPRTRVQILIGAKDCGSAVPNAMLFYNAITSEKVIEFVPGTPHWVATTAKGRDAILRALLGGVACRPGSITLKAMPRVGGKFDLDVHGPAGKAYMVAIATGPERIEVNPLGWLFLKAPLIPLGGGSLNVNTGRATYSLGVPANPALAGLEFYDQVLAGTCLSNLLRVKIMP